VIQVLELGPGLLGYAFNGKIEKPDIERVFADMDAKVPANEKVGIYTELNDVGGITPEALLRDLQLGATRLNYLGRIGKVAVVTDSNAWGTWSKIEGKVLRWLELRVFASSEKEAALTWLGRAAGA
jgi:hypothetical protein